MKLQWNLFLSSSVYIRRSSSPRKMCIRDSLTAIVRGEEKAEAYFSQNQGIDWEGPYDTGLPVAGSKTVSYTHLDVYKRQVNWLYGAGQMCQELISTAFAN